MAGTSIRLDYDISDREVRRALRRLANFQEREALADVGEDLLIRHRNRFEQERAPDGTPWQPLSDRYRRRKKKNADKILTFEGYLKDTLRYQIDGSILELGTDRIYGATHQFGDPDRNIPARPFLGLSADDSAAVISILKEHVSRAIGR